MSAVVSVPQRRLKYLASINDESLGEDTDPDFEIRYIDIGNVDSSGNIGELSSYSFGDAPSRARRRVRDGDVIISTVRTYLQAITQVRNPPENMIVSTGFAVVRPRPGFDANYCKYTLREKGFLAEVEKRSVGVNYPAINAIDLANVPVYIHPLPRQRAIADYLDRETERLDTLVAAKERLLVLLAEKRQALIDHAVLRGIEDNVASCDLGSPWLDEIPVHWRVGRIKDFGSLLGGVGFPHKFQGVEGEILPFYKVGDLASSIDDRYMVSSPNTISSETAATLRAHVIPEESIVYAKIGAALLLNKRRITTAPCVIDNNMTAYIPKSDDLTSGWAFYWMSVLDFGMFANPGAVPSFSEGAQGQLPIAIPPVSEQHAITDYLDRETARIDELAARTRDTIPLLKERRAALVAAAVTGQIDMECAS